MNNRKREIKSQIAEEIKKECESKMRGEIAAINLRSGKDFDVEIIENAICNTGL